MENSSSHYSPSQPSRGPQISFDSISEAWKYLQPNLGPWIGATLIYAVVTGVFSALSPKDSAGQPEIGAAYWMLSLLSFVSGQFLLGGLMRMAIHTVRTGRAEFGLLFSTFDVLPALLIAGILTPIASAIGFLLCIVPGLLLLGLFLFVNPLIVDQKKGAIEAISTSFNALKSQMWMALLYVIVLGLVLLAGLIACGVGILVTLPLILLAIAVTYRDFFLTGAPPTAQPFVPIAPIADPNS